jgi:DNA-binding response OmpR family regulator
MKKIIIAEDEAHIRRLIEQSLEELEDEGIELLFAEDGEQALALFHEHRPSLLLLDVMMPKLDGFEVCARVRQDLDNQQVHIIILTAKGHEYDRAAGERAGANQYLTKPFNPDALLLTVRQALVL